MAGEPVPTDPLGGDDVHLEEHEDFMMSATYQEAIRKPGGEQIRMIVEMHVQGHRDNLQRAANEQAMAQAAQTALENNTPGPGVSNGAVPPANGVPSASA
jgi:hypothetical protein